MAANNAPSPSYFQKTVTLLDWWLIKPETNDHSKTLGVAGLTSQQNQPARRFSSAPILKIFDLFELETVDGVCVLLRGFINKERTLENGFSPEVFNHFVVGFPPYWKEYCSKIESADKCVTTAQEENEKNPIEEHGGDFHSKPQNSVTYTVDTGVQDCKDIMLNDKTRTTLIPSSAEIPHEDIIEAGNEVLCERSPLTPEFEDNPSLRMSPIVSNGVDSCTQSKFSGVSGRCITRSMKKLDNKKAANDVNCDMKSNSGKIISKSSEDMVIKMEIKEKQIDQTVDLVITKDARNKDDADVSGESHIDIKITDLEEEHITPECSDPLNNTSVGVTDVNDDTAFARTNTKGSRNKKKSRIDVPQKQGAPATSVISSKEEIMTLNRSKTKLPVKRKLITSPKSAKSTPSRGKKGSEERDGSANILSIESFSGKRSRSGRVILPPLEFWRNQKVIYDEDREMFGVQQPN